MSRPPRPYAASTLPPNVSLYPATYLTPSDVHPLLSRPHPLDLVVLLAALLRDLSDPPVADLSRHPPGLGEPADLARDVPELLEDRDVTLCACPHEVRGVRLG